MAPAHSKVSFADRKGQKRVVVPPVPLRRVEDKLKKGEYVSIHCRSISTDKDLTTYELAVPYFKTGNTEKFLRFLEVFEKACTGQDCTTGPQKFSLMDRLLQGDALAAFNAHKPNRMATETNEAFEKCVKKLTAYVCPP
jgi:hypothetical protein